MTRPEDCERLSDPLREKIGSLFVQYLGAAEGEQRNALEGELYRPVNALLGDGLMLRCMTIGHEGIFVFTEGDSTESLGNDLQVRVFPSFDSLQDGLRQYAHDPENSVLASVSLPHDQLLSWAGVDAGVEEDDGWLGQFLVQRNANDQREMRLYNAMTGWLQENLGMTQGGCQQSLVWPISTENLVEGQARGTVQVFLGQGGIDPRAVPALQSAGHPISLHPSGYYQVFVPLNELQY